MANPFQEKKPSKSSSKYSLDTVFNFGKYVKDEELRNKDGSIKTLKEVIDIDSAYIEWCIINIPTFDIDQEADEYFQEKLDEPSGDYRHELLDWQSNQFFGKD